MHPTLCPSKQLWITTTDAKFDNFIEFINSLISEIELPPPTASTPITSIQIPFISGNQQMTSRQQTHNRTPQRSYTCHHNVTLDSPSTHTDWTFHYRTNPAIQHFNPSMAPTRTYPQSSRPPPQHFTRRPYQP